MLKSTMAATAMVVILAVAVVARADVLTFQEGVGGYTGTKDTYLNQGSGNANYGSNSRIVMDGRGGREADGLIRFEDIFGAGANRIPLGSTINSATLVFTLAYEERGKTFHRMLVTWDVDTATWNNFLYDAAPTEAGLQSDDTESATVVTASGGAWAGPYDVTVDVQAWSAGTDNFGWGIQGTSNDGHAHSSEATTPGNRPLLTVDFTPIPEPGSAALLIVAGVGALLRRRRK